MNKKIGNAAFGLGLVAIIWVAIGYAGSAHLLALTTTLMILGVYVFGGLELHRFHRDTVALADAMRSLPQTLVSLDVWLAGLPSTLRNAVRTRIEGERIALPGPAVTPYLVGLLVMLGMLGTFLGMVVTLNGAVLALDGSTDLATIRAALSAPVKGLGLAFGTSVAGVAASAMLGLVSSLCRREQLEVGLLLDTHIAGALREFSLTHQRQETFRAMQQQAQVLPVVADKLAVLMDALERQNQATQDRLTAGQSAFHREVQATYTALAESVERSLRTALADSARDALNAIPPAIETALDGFARTAGAQHERIAATVERQIDGLVSHVDRNVTETAARWTDTLDARQTAHVRREEERLAVLMRTLEAVVTTLQTSWQANEARALARDETLRDGLQNSVRDFAEQTTIQAHATLDEIRRLIDAASSLPQVAGEVMSRLHDEVAEHRLRDNTLLEERHRLAVNLEALIGRLQTSATTQEAAVDTLVRMTSSHLDQATTTLSARFDSEAARLTEGTAQIAASAAEVASLGEAFGHAVDLFSHTGEHLTANLQRLEQALEQAMVRSDDQLAYYVAQAREIIDLSVMSQQRVVEDLRHLSGRDVLTRVGAC